MKLIQLSYIDSKWELQNLEFGAVNLIVSKNATGKSRTLSTIDLLVKMITQKKNLNWGGRWKLQFSNLNKQIIEYKFGTSQRDGGIVTSEWIAIDGKVVLNRKLNAETVITSSTGQREIIFPPANKLVLHVRRDVKLYPFLEEITQWAEQSYGFKFGNISPYTKLNEQEYGLLTAVEDIPMLFKVLQKENKANIIRQFNELGYQSSAITVQDKVEYMILLVKEVGIDKPLPHYKLSQGMFRTLAMLIYIEYLISLHKPVMLIIDDLCEGLDYERAKKLGSLIFEKCLNTDIQLIVTSNDSFFMDVIDIQYWNILKRTGHVVTAMNVKTHPELFSNFKFTGLSNFDFFASDFLQQTS
jgi:AAA15 family ATPase/GTPase